MSLDEAVEESPKKFYVAYKVSQNFVCMEVKKNKVILYLKLDASEVKNIPTNARDVRDIGHYGTGDFELSIRTQEEAESAREYIKLS